MNWIGFANGNSFSFYRFGSCLGGGGAHVAVLNMLIVFAKQSFRLMENNK